ncbi:MAG: hypothetical protein QM754_04140 [Tepidisphaeraceae bacterium]
MTFTPTRPVSGSAEQDGVTQSLPTDSTPVELHALQSAAIEIDGVGRITVNGGITDAPQLAQKLREANAEWRRQAAAFATDELFALEALAADRVVLEQRLLQERTRAGDANELRSLRQQLADIQACQRELLADEPALAERSESLDVARAIERTAKQDRKSRADSLRQAEQELERQAGELKSAETAAEKVVQSLVQSQAVAKERERMATERRAADGLSDAERARLLADAAAAVDAAYARLAAAAKPPVEEIGGEIAAAERVAEQLQTELSALNHRRGELAGRLKLIGAAGLYSQWVEASERVETLKVQLARAA